MEKESEQELRRRRSISDARGITDEKLERERNDTDEELASRLARVDRHTDDVVDKTRRASDRVMESLAQETPSRVVEEAELVMANERERIEAARSTQRKEARRAFVEVLKHEREETDVALGIERTDADVLLSNRDEMLAMISHDLRNLIQGISLKVQLLNHILSGAVSGDPAPLAAVIERSCVVMTRWAGDLVDVASLNAGVLSLEFRTWRPLDLVNEAVQDLISQAADKRIGLSVEVTDPAREIYGDHVRIVQVLTNLLHNAIKFTPEAGQIWVRSQPSDGVVRFSVTDTGPGIPPGDRSAIFLRRWHAGQHAGGGAGLGLYICKRLVDWHGGEIWVEDDPRGGTTFAFTLPLAPALPSPMIRAPTVDA